MSIYQSLGQRQAQEAEGWVQDEFGNWVVPGSPQAAPGQLAWKLGAPTAASEGLASWENNPGINRSQGEQALRGLQGIQARDTRTPLRRQADTYAQQKYPGVR
jgi:hypothetical protein